MSHGRAAPGRPVPHPALPQQHHFLPWQPRGARRGRGSAEPRGGINIAKPPEAPRAPGLCPAATARFTPCATGHRHRHRAGAAPQQLAEPRRGGGVKCRVINTPLVNALRSAVAGVSWELQSGGEGLHAWPRKWRGYLCLQSAAGFLRRYGRGTGTRGHVTHGLDLHPLGRGGVFHAFILGRAEPAPGL